jgi:hypothetical protein
MSSSHEDILKRGHTNGFDTLEASIKALREQINVVKCEPAKFDINEIEVDFKKIETDEKICRGNSDAYIRYLEYNKR